MHTTIEQLASAVNIVSNNLNDFVMGFWGFGVLGFWGGIDS